MTEPADQPGVLLITGHIRSGTTILRQVCNSHRQMRITHEWAILLDLDLTYRRHCRRMLYRSYRRLRRPGRRTVLPALRYTAHLLRHRPAVVDLPTVYAALRSALGGAPIVGDKLPSYWQYLDRFALLPDLRRVFIYRDCRDVVSSVLERCRGRWQHRSHVRIYDTASKAAASWRSSVERMEQHRSALYIISYEALVTDPARELAALAQWLGIDEDGFSSEWISKIRSTSIGNHRSGLSRQELDSVLEVAGPEMRQLGYL